MKRLAMYGLSLSLILLWGTFSLFAQEAEQPQSQMLMVYELTVSPANMPAMTEAWKKNVAKMKEHQPQLALNCFQTDDGRFIFVSPISNMASLDQDPMAGMAEEMGMEAFSKMWQPVFEAATSLDNYILSMPAGLSYVPETAAQKLGKSSFRKWEFFYLHPAYAMEIDALGQRFHALHQKYNIPEGYAIIRDEIGQRGPLVVVETWGETLEELYQDHNAGRSEAYKAERAALNQEFAKMIVSSETVVSRVRPDLSYSPEVEVAKK